MKKLLLSLLLLVPGTSLFAECKIDLAKQKYYSIPASSYVNQEEYHSLITKLGSIIDTYSTIKSDSINNLLSDDAFAKEVRDRILLYLVTVGTPTAERVLMDIFKLKFFGLNFIIN